MKTRRCDGRSSGQSDEGPPAKECEQLLEAGKGKEMEYPPEPPEKLSSTNTFLFRTSDLLDCKVIKVICLKPLSWWCFVTAATENHYRHLNS